MAQLAGTYTENLAIAVEGQIGDGATDSHIMTYTDDTNASLFGRAFIADLANPGEGQVPLTVTGTFVGVTVHTHDVEASQVPLATEAIPATQPLNILSKGRIWVFPEDAVTALDDDIYFRHANAGVAPEGVGRFRTDDDAASGDVTQITIGARWLTLGGAGTPVLLEVNLPQ